MSKGIKIHGIEPHSSSRKFPDPILIDNTEGLFYTNSYAPWPIKYHVIIKRAREMVFAAASKNQCAAMFTGIKHIYKSNMWFRTQQRYSSSTGKLLRSIGVKKTDVYADVAKNSVPPLLGKGILEIMNDERIWISYSPTCDPEWGGHSGTSLDLAISPLRVVQGVHYVAGTILHELAHLAGVTSDDGFHKFAVAATVNCLPDHFKWRT